MFRPTEGHILRADNSEECVSRRPASRTSDRKQFYHVFVVNHLKLEANGSARKADSVFAHTFMDGRDINTRWQRSLITDGWTVKDSRSARTPSRLCHNVKSSWNMNAGRSSDGFCTPDPRAHPSVAGFINPSDWGCLAIAASFLDLAF